MTDIQPIAKYSKDGCLKQRRTNPSRNKKREVPQLSNKLTKVEKKAMTLEKGKWIPKVVITPAISYKE